MEPYERSELGGVGWGYISQAQRRTDRPHPNPSPKGEGLIKAYPFFLGAGFFAGVAAGAL